VTQTANVADYAKLARAAIDEIIARGRVPVLAGGSGLYVREHSTTWIFPERTRLSAHLSRRSSPGSERRRAAHQAGPARPGRGGRRSCPATGGRIVRALEVIEISGRRSPRHAGPSPRTARPSRSASPCRGPNSTSGLPPASTGCGRRAWKPRCGAWPPGAARRQDRQPGPGLPAAAPLPGRRVGPGRGPAGDDEGHQAVRPPSGIWFRRDPRVRWLDASQPADAVATEALGLIRTA